MMLRQLINGIKNSIWFNYDKICAISMTGKIDGRGEQKLKIVMRAHKANKQWI
jgi:hypothetical protein